MAHHGNEDSKPTENPNILDFLEEVNKLKNKLNDEKLGATGKFPQGKLTENDEGEIKISIGSSKGKVVIDFGKSIAWIGFDPQQAHEIADLIKRHADNIR